MDDEDLIAGAQAYAARYQLKVIEQLGFGIHGIVCVVESNAYSASTALKVFHNAEAYLRERQIYERLRDERVESILGFRIPQLIRWDDGLRAIEMTIVSPPFLLDFAGAYLNAAPEFPADVWEEWEAEKNEQFGERWETVQILLIRLQALGIFMVDPSPKNIRFE